MSANSPVSQLGNFVDRLWGVSEIGGNGTRSAQCSCSGISRRKAAAGVWM